MAASGAQPSYDADRARLVDGLRGLISDQRVLDAISQVPREQFLSPEQQQYAYENRPLPIGHGQTTSQPLIIALMLQQLRLTASDRVLEVGAGCGYQTALLAELAAEVIGVELIPALAEQAARSLARLGYTTARVELARDQIGWPEAGPYDAIIVAAAAPRVPAALMLQLAPGGRLVIPVGDRQSQELIVAEKAETGISVRREGACSFVPLLGRDAFTTSI